MNKEIPNIEGEQQERSLEQEMQRLRESLEHIKDGENVDYEHEIQGVYDQLDNLYDRFDANDELQQKIRMFERRVSTITLALAGLVSLFMRDRTQSTVVVLGAFSLSMLPNYFGSRAQKKAQEIVKDINELMAASRELTDAHLQQGGATYTEDGRLDVTTEQMEQAREEMNKDIENEKSQAA